MITAAPGATFEATTAKFAHAATVGVRIRDNEGADFLVRTVAGVTEDVTVASAAVFRRSFTAPATLGQWTIVWDDGTNIDTEELVVTYTPNVAPTGTLYVTSDELKATLEITGETYADDDITVAITSASRVIDAYKDTRFYSTTETRRYTADRCIPTLPIYDLNSLTSLAVDMDGDGVYEQTWARDTDFYLEPIDASLTGRPWDQVTIRRLSARVWPTWQYGVEIVGGFGWAAAPVQVQQAARILAGRYLKRARETPYGILTIGTDALAAARLGKIDPDVAFLLDNIDADPPIMVM